jgi:hypothetical protein
VLGVVLPFSPSAAAASAAASQKAVAASSVADVAVARPVLGLC